MDRRARTDHPVHELIARRFSPCGFQERQVPADDLRSLFEAARWAPSSYNEQPWSYIVATRDDPARFADLLSCLVEANQAWAARAPVLVICVARNDLARLGRPNTMALHDVGLASATLTFEATARGLAVHQMAGILPDRARELYSLPENVAAVTALAIGFAADPSALPEALRERDTAPRTRKRLEEFVFGGAWGKPHAIVAAPPRRQSGR